MKRWIKEEFHRWFLPWLGVMMAYLTIISLLFSTRSWDDLIGESLSIDLMVLVVVFIGVLSVLLDRTRPRKELYFFSSLSDRQLRWGRLVVIFLFALMTSILAIARYHLKLIWTEDPYAMGGPVLQVLLRVDNMFFGKEFLECLHPLNWLLSLMVLAWFALRTQDLIFYFRKKNPQMRYVPTFLGVLSGLVIFSASLLVERGLMLAFPGIDWNWWNERIRMYEISTIEWNFLFLLTVPIIAIVMFLFSLAIDGTKSEQTHRWG